MDTLDANIDRNRDSNILTSPEQTPEAEADYTQQIRRVFKAPQRRLLKYVPGGPFGPTKITRSQSCRVASIKSITGLVEGGFFKARDTSAQSDKSNTERNEVSLAAPINITNVPTGGSLIKQAWSLKLALLQASSTSSPEFPSVSTITLSSVADISRLNPLKSSIPAPRITSSGTSASTEQPAHQSYDANPTAIANLEKEILKKIQTFPTVVHQQTKGSNFTSNWNWHNIFQKQQKDAETSANDYEKYKSVHNFYTQVNTAGLILGQIRHDFENGLPPYDPCSGDSNSAMKQVCRAGVRGRTAISDNMIPYLPEIFKQELKKQDAYAKWSARILTDAMNVKRRNALVTWIMQTAKLILYAAETAHLAVYFIDAYLGIKGNKVATTAWGLVGITALHIAGKLEEPTPAKIRDLIQLSLSVRSFKAYEVRLMEKDILAKLQFDLYPPLPSVLTQMVLLGGSLEFPNIHMRKLALDLSKGILYKSLLNHELVIISPADKAKAALEIAVEAIFYQYNICMSRDMRYYDPTSGTAIRDPGQSMGQFMLNLCIETYSQRFLNRKLPPVIPAVTCLVSPVRNLKV